MKRCPACGQTYTDNDLNFCLNDGAVLTNFSDDAPPTLFGNEPPRRTGFADDPPPTVLLNKPRVTNQTNWQSAQPPVPWQNQPQNLQNRPYAAFTQSRDQTLPTISLVLGILSLVMMCCYGGIWLGVPAAVVGFLGMRNADNDPVRYGGRGMAIGGLVLGIISFLIFIGSIIFIIFAGSF